MKKYNLIEKFKNMGKNRKILIGITFIGLGAVLTTLIATSYAMLTKSGESEKKDLFASKDMTITFNEVSGSEINIDPAIPVTDEKGLKTTPYEFTITNSGDYKGSYTIKLVENSNTTLPLENIKYSINGSYPKFLSNENQIIETGIIRAGNSKNFELRLWITEEATTDISGQIYSGKIQVSGQAEKLKHVVSNNHLMLTNGYEHVLDGLKIYGNSLQGSNNLFDIDDWNNFLTTNQTSSSYPNKVGIDSGRKYLAVHPGSGRYALEYMKDEFEENTQYKLEYWARQEIINDDGPTTGLIIYYTDGTNTRKYVDNSTTWKKYTLTSTENKTISHISMMYNHGGYVYFSSITLTKIGVPTPDNPIEIQSVGDKTINLFDDERWLDLLLSVDNSAYPTTTGVDGDYKYIATFPKNPNIEFMKGEFEENTQYTISFFGKLDDENKLNGTGLLITYTDGTTTRMLLNSTSWKKYSVTTTADKTISSIGLYYYCHTRGYYSDIMLTEGTEVVEYELYDKYKIPVKVSGKNLFPLNNIDQTIAWGTAYFAPVEIDVKPNTNYHLWWESFERDHTQGNIVMYLYTNSNLSSNIGNVIFAASGSDRVYTGSTFNTGENTKLYLALRNNQSKETNVKVTNLMLEEGNARTTYSPYIEPTTTNIYLDEPLRKVGDYADYIDFENNKIVRNIQENVYNGGEDWKLGTPQLTNTYIFGFYTNSPVSKPVAKGNYSLCNKFITRLSGTSSVDAEFVQVYGNYIFIRMNKSRVSSASIDEIKSWLSTNPITVSYVLETPKETEIELPTLPSYDNDLIVTVDTSIPTPLEIDY